MADGGASGFAWACDFLAEVFTADEDRLTDEAVRLAVDAAFPGLPGGMTMEEAERRVRAAIVAYLRAVTA